MHTITSLQHPLVKSLVQLRLDRKERESRKKVLILGQKMVMETSRVLPLEILILEEEILPPCSAASLVHVSTAVMKKISGLAHPEPYAAVVPIPSPAPLDGKNFLLVLDQIADPGNLGTLFRSALALSWEGVICLSGTTDPFNDKALRAAKGATFLLPFCWMDKSSLDAFVQKNHFHSFLADLQGKSPEGIVFEKPLLLILSNESHGPSPWAQKFSKVSIPLSSQVDSLNVATAGSILLYLMRKGL